ncbi:hypothetical protein GCM10011383_17780 [Hymenobacter cavernae]|uniref:WG repeat-containing protein n=1 Tax=Hymenobacter cavernae TaxID=2044852 RepID=A0ABQ1TZK3_9BACT|nr:hypothetical protein GCM10011383_17780 [Hymenobacter cavernae]
MQFAVQKNGDYLYGYKDKNGHVRVPAKFGNFTNAQKFTHIIAVSEAGTHQQYYLLRNGRKVGVDSVYMFDFTFDCEREGKIRFEDRKKNRIGFLNIQGRAIIPAMYNFVTPFQNGLAVARVGARAKCWSSENDTIRCEHLGWVGGRDVLINERNEILADSLAEGQWAHLNWYSLKINPAEVDTALTSSFRGKQGDRYTFINYEKEFTQWLYEVFVPAVRTGNDKQVAALCFPELAVAARPFKGWPHFQRAAFMTKYYQSVLRPKLGMLHRDSKNVAVLSEELNTYIFSGSLFQLFMTDCGAHFQDKYPVFDVMLTYAAPPGQKSDEYHNHFEFIRTPQGYRLLSVGL